MASSSPPNNTRTQATGIPSTSTFLFKAPFPVSSPSPAIVSALKHRRVSLASPSSPRIVKPHTFRDEMGLSQDPSSSFVGDGDLGLPEKKGKMRKIDSMQGSDESSLPILEKKPRKKWSSEETQMLVKGCNKYGVGNWKIILQDPELQFHDRSAVDLKDRFRTYFPDAYKLHYPNAKTHLSTKIRATFPDGSSMFEKTRSKRRRPFTEAEDRALKAGYDKHGTTWATIVKDPIFQEQNRRSTDLRDRFRNAFPDLYQAAGYKPRTAVKKKLDGPLRAADDQLSMSTAGPVRSRRRAQTCQGLLRGGTKSVPQSTACSEDEESSAGEEDHESYVFKSPPTPVFVDNVSTMPFRPMKKMSPTTIGSSSSAPTLSSSARGPYSLDDDDEMQLITDDTDPLQIPDFLPNNTHSDMETWPSGLNTPTHSSTAAWSTAAASPTSSNPSDYLMNQHSGNNNPNNLSTASSPYIPRHNDPLRNNFGMIGKSAWGTDDWFSPNPRLDARSASSSTSSSFIDASFSPASPFSFHPHLNHGVLDRYDLFPPYIPDGHASEAGMNDTHTAFSDELGGGSGVNGSNGASSGGTGFKGYHSQIAGDLISGAGARMHHHQQSQFSASASASLSLSTLYNSPFGSGFGGVGGGEILGLGLEGMQQENVGIHPMQLHAHTPSLSAIDELGLTGISLNDHVDSSACSGGGQLSNNLAEDAMETTDSNNSNVLGMSFAMPSRSPRKQHRQNSQSQKELKENRDALDTSLGSDLLGLEDIVDMNELHATPPATPLMTQPRPMRRSSGGNILHSFDHSGMGGGHARSISVPPSEARNGTAQQHGVPMSMDDVGLHMHSHANGGGGMQPEFGMMGRSLQSFFNMSSPSHNSSPGDSSAPQHQAQRLDIEDMRLSNSTGSLQSPISPVHDQQQHSSQLTPLFPAHLILSPSSPSGIISLPHSSSQSHSSSSSSSSLNQVPAADQVNSDLWRTAFSAGDYYNYNLSFLDLHYYSHGNATYGGMMASHNGHNSLGLDVTLDDYSDARQGQALDLAQSAVLASSSSMGIAGLGLNLGLGVPLRAFDTPSPVATVRHHAREAKHASLSNVFVAPAPPTPVAASAASQQQQRHDRPSDGASSTPIRPAIRNGARTVSGTGSGTTRQSHAKANNPGVASLGRSMSHHRGQSAVCPQDLILRNDNKRKRASWDGGVV